MGRGHAEMALADDRGDQREQFEALLFHAAMGGVGVHAQLGRQALQVGVARHFDVGIPGVVHAHERRGGQCGIGVAFRQAALEGFHQHRAARGISGGQGGAYGVFRGQRRAGNHGVQIQADVLGPIRELFLNGGKKFHSFYL
ncbi:hypothetical protein G6F68_015699 [Rhizopus microsporus]|nr:hypothetical protein G6F68_015699 [Rhizopus microsporus]